MAMRTVSSVLKRASMNISASEITPKNVSRAIEARTALEKRGGSEGNEVTRPCILPAKLQARRPTYAHCSVKARVVKHHA